MLDEAPSAARTLSALHPDHAVVDPPAGAPDQTASRPRPHRAPIVHSSRYDSLVPSIPATAWLPPDRRTESPGETHPLAGAFGWGGSEARARIRQCRLTLI
jgi:hypothetical protein